MPALYVMNKIDQLTIEELDIIDQMPHHVPISSFHKWNIDMLMEEIWNYLKMMRIYTKPKGQIPDYEEPVVLHGGLECLKIESTERAKKTRKHERGMVHSILCDSSIDHFFCQTNQRFFSFATGNSYFSSFPLFGSFSVLPLALFFNLFFFAV